MKLRIKSTGEVVDAELIGHGIFRDIFGVVHLWDDAELQSEPICLSTVIDWEQRRYEIAKEMLPAVHRHNYEDECDMSVNEIVSNSILYADELIKQLKGGDK